MIASSTLTNIAFAPIAPWPLIAVLAILSAALVIFAVIRRARGVWWRALGLAVALLALLNPALVEENRESLADVAVIVVDESASQHISDRQAQTAQAVEHLVQELGDRKNLDLRIVMAGRDRQRKGETPASGTVLFAALDQALIDVPRRRVAGVMIITDGQVHDVPVSLDALGFQAPLHLFLTGDRQEADRRLVIVKAPRYGIVGKPLALRLRIEDSAADVDAGGDISGGRDLAKLTMRIDAGEPKTSFVSIGVSHEIKFTLERAGTTLMEFSVDGGPAELSLINNRAVVAVNGVRDRLRVLLISGEAHTGERVWRNLLKSDPSVDLVHFTILRPPEKQDSTPIRELALISFPIRDLFEIKLKEFDLIIFDRYRRRGVVPLSYLNNIAEFVEEGGALLTATGPAYAGPLSLYLTPLNNVLPADPTGEVFEGGFLARLTDIGRRHPVTATLPGAAGAGETPEWGRWFRQIEVIAHRGSVLMEGAENKPILLLDRVKKGRVAQLFTDHLWLWARGFEGGGPQAELLRRVSHWLMKEPDLEEEDLRTAVQGSRLTIIRRSLTPAVEPVTVTSPLGETREVTLEDTGNGRAAAVISVDDPGLYRLSDGVRSAIAMVGEMNPLEFADLRAGPNKLEPLTSASGGVVTWIGDGALPRVRMTRPDRDTAGHGWIGLIANQDYVVTGIRQAPLMAEWLVLLLALGGLMLAWRSEGR
ncbi:MAG: hypothetical protein VCD50_07280 [Alphaproteobacteria bacterium]